MRYELSEKQMQWAEETYARLLQKITAQNARIGTDMPYIPVDGRYEDMGKKALTWWTNSFWCGILWQMYHATGEESFRQNARGTEERLNRALERYMELDHDIGFLWLHTAVADYRVCRGEDGSEAAAREQARVRGLHAAALLASRFQPRGSYFRAWNNPGQSQAIIDCLMNLPLLYWGSETTGNPSWKQLAMAHADMALEHIIRPDGSCNHIVIFDMETGECVDKPAGQGYAPGSSWSRGQSWAIYGMALSYRYTGKQDYLDASKKVAHYFLANAAMNDYDVLLDFRAPAEPVYYDNTAAACAACGLLELSEHVSEYEKRLYVDGAARLLERLTERFCNWNADEDGITTHGSARYQRASDREVPIIYGDYFLVEAILRLLDRDILLW